MVQYRAGARRGSGAPYAGAVDRRSQQGKEPDLVYEFTYRAQIDPPVDVGPGPAGQRMVFAVTGGEVEG